MTDDQLVKRVAAVFVRRKGSGAVSHLLDRAEIAEGRGDLLSAQTWRDIAKAAVLILALTAMAWPKVSTSISPSPRFRQGGMPQIAPTSCRVRTHLISSACGLEFGVPRRSASW